jgi:hypothetical protein
MDIGAHGGREIQRRASSAKVRATQGLEHRRPWEREAAERATNTREGSTARRRTEGWLGDGRRARGARRRQKRQENLSRHGSREARGWALDDRAGTAREAGESACCHKAEEGAGRPGDDGHGQRAERVRAVDRVACRGGRRREEDAHKTGRKELEIELELARVGR